MNTLFATFQSQFGVWRFLRIAALCTLLAVAYSITSEALSLSHAVTWVKTRVLALSWPVSGDADNHYRMMVQATDILATPVSSSITLHYVRQPEATLELLEDHAYQVWVQSVDRVGNFSAYSDSTNLLIYEGGEAAKQRGDLGNPGAFSLSQNFPNPFNSRTTIEYIIGDDVAYSEMTQVNLSIYNILGQEIATLVDEPQPAGTYGVVWDGRDDSGAEAATGNYVYQLRAGGMLISKKMLYIK